MGFFKACKNCGKRNPIHTCYTGGSKTSLYYDDKCHDNVAKQMELNRAQGKPEFSGIPQELRSRYMQGRPR
jgi:hypothetical protein